jgi:hypothetical protein
MTQQGMLKSLRQVTIKVDIMVSFARMVVISYPGVGRIAFLIGWHAMIIRSNPSQARATI